MKLRKLEMKDAPLMLEWMHDDDVVQNMKINFKIKTLEECEQFINESKVNNANLHLAIVDEFDEYMGTVSLKHVEKGTAEFGITVRRCAMGKGFSSEGMKEMIHIGFAQLHLNEIYWCVDPLNTRAIKFYDKNGYERCKKKILTPGYSADEIERFIWYHCIQST